MITRRWMVLAWTAALAASAAAQPAETGASRGQQRLTSAESYVPLPAINVGVVGRYRTEGVITVEMGLDIPDARLRTRALANRPRLSDALRQSLSTYASTYYRANTAPDIATMKRLMQASVDRALGGPGAQVLFSGVIFQRRPA